MDGTTQENISKEVEEIARKRFGSDATVSFQVGFLDGTVHVSIHTDVALFMNKYEPPCVFFCACRTPGLLGDVWSKEKGHHCDHMKCLCVNAITYI